MTTRAVIALATGLTLIGVSNAYAYPALCVDHNPNGRDVTFFFAPNGRAKGGIEGIQKLIVLQQVTIQKVRWYKLRAWPDRLFPKGAYLGWAGADAAGVGDPRPFIQLKPEPCNVPL